MRSIMTLLTLAALAFPAAAEESELPQGSQMPEESQGLQQMPQWPELPRPSELPQMPANWEPTTRLNSAGLAAAGMENTGTAALSLIDGQHAVVTFWTAAVAGQIGQSLAFRCMTFFDEDLVETGETCD